jgi:O-acetylhomoserine/O-acetylserine sulfhydrylase-like pyridoxal-dependent enzyme
MARDKNFSQIFRTHSSSRRLILAQAITLLPHQCDPDPSMTHSGVARELREEIGLTDALIRISIGIENVEDLISDLAQGLERV